MKIILLLSDRSFKNIFTVIRENAKTIKARKYFDGINRGLFDITTLTPMKRKKNAIKANSNGEYIFI